MMDNEEKRNTPDYRPDDTAQPKQPQDAGSTADEAVEVVDSEPDSGVDAAQTFSPDGHEGDGPGIDISVTVESEAAEQQAPALMYPVVAFGASAGGLQAFREVLENLNPHTGMAFVLVTHLAPDQKSFMSEIVERFTEIPVHHVENGQRPLPDNLYVVMPNQSVTMREGAFQVGPRPQHERIPRTIDTFFRSLAADQKNHAIGVVLSGADADGALGLKAIKGEGGIAIVQSPDTAIQSNMPRSSIASDHVDLVIPPAEIAVELGRLAAQFVRPEVRSLDEGTIAPDDEQSFNKISSAHSRDLGTGSADVQAGDHSPADCAADDAAADGAAQRVLPLFADAQR